MPVASGGDPTPGRFCGFEVLWRNGSGRVGFVVLEVLSRWPESGFVVLEVLSRWPESGFVVLKVLDDRCRSWQVSERTVHPIEGS
jgi:hypothetical protein